MRCKFCGTTLPDYAKFCPGCGKEIDNDRERHESREASNIPEDAYYTNTNKKNSKRKRRHKKISVRFIIVYLIVVLTGGFCLYRMGFPEKVVEMLSKQSSVPDSKKEISQKSDKKKNNEKKTGKATTEKKKDKNENKKTLESTESTLAYTDNSSMNVGACLSPEDYNTVTAKDDSFSFAYPKYLFNHSEVNEEETSYTFSYKGNSASDSNEAELSVYTQENEGDPLQNARELYQNFSSEVYKKYFKMYPSRVDSSGMARTLIGASADSSEKTGVYIIAANDGKRDYILKFTYPDPDMTNDYNEIDYVVDCVYRFCSFSGGTYQPRSYQQFLDDNMGSKK